MAPKSGPSKNSHGGLVAAVIILAIVSLAAGGYLFYNEYWKNRCKSDGDCKAGYGCTNKVCQCKGTRKVRFKY